MRPSWRICCCGKCKTVLTQNYVSYNRLHCFSPFSTLLKFVWRTLLLVYVYLIVLILFAKLCVIDKNSNRTHCYEANNLFSHLDTLNVKVSSSIHLLFQYNITFCEELVIKLSCLPSYLTITFILVKYNILLLKQVKSVV